MSESEKSGSFEDRLLKFIDSFSISPEDAEKLVNGYTKKARKVKEAGQRAEETEQDIVAGYIVSYYAKISSATGGATALAGVVPGLGTVAASVGGSLADISIGVKLQVDMCRCLAVLFGHNLRDERARHLALLIAGLGTLEKFGQPFLDDFATKTGIKIVKTYLRGNTLVVVREIFKKIGITFTRKGLEKAIPFGVGVALGSSTNFLMTKFVGRKAIQAFKNFGEPNDAPT